MNFPNIRNPEAKRALGRQWGRLSAKAWTPQEPDADTVRRRALHDARGTTLREGVTYTAQGSINWSVTRSTVGRTDQRDVVVDGKIFKTCGSRKLPFWLR